MYHGIYRNGKVFVVDSRCTQNAKLLDIMTRTLLGINSEDRVMFVLVLLGTTYYADRVYAA